MLEEKMILTFSLTMWDCDIIINIIINVRPLLAFRDSLVLGYRSLNLLHEVLIWSHAKQAMAIIVIPCHTMRVSEWNSERRAAYDIIFRPAIKDKMLGKKQILELQMKHPNLKYFSYTKLRNKVNADVQKARRNQQMKANDDCKLQGQKPLATQHDFN